MPMQKLPVTWVNLGQYWGTTIAKLKGDDWGYCWNAGILYELEENNRYNFTYRSEVKIKFNGDYSNELPPSHQGV